MVLSFVLRAKYMVHTVAAANHLSANQWHAHLRRRRMQLSVKK
jgi:hypothetical protein